MWLFYDWTICIGIYRIVSHNLVPNLLPYSSHSLVSLQGCPNRNPKICEPDLNQVEQLCCPVSYILQLYKNNKFPIIESYFLLHLQLLDGWEYSSSYHYSLILFFLNQCHFNPMRFDIWNWIFSCQILFHIMRSLWITYFQIIYYENHFVIAAFASPKYKIGHCPL